MTQLFPEIVYFFALYAAIRLVDALSNQREFRKHPDKGARYKLLPLPYKMACWFVVSPLAAGVVVHEAFAGVALVLFFVLDIACRRWYRKAGLF